ncbi:hypothetical protein V5799_005567 [Amblyomma americanum]|uniref:Uncharacterized protein n=1 Tax=Amblyomma americanum TaxID=6943 RepID=A0AAQ4DYW2_AMBAM
MEQYDCSDHPVCQKKISGYGMSCTGLQKLSLYVMEILRPDSPTCGMESTISEKRNEGSVKNRHLAAVFLDDNSGIVCQAFHRGKNVALCISPVHNDLESWEAATVTRIPPYKFTEEEIFRTYLTTKPAPVQADVSSACRDSVVAFLEKLGASVPEDVRRGNIPIERPSAEQSSVV